ncbi:MAG: hypothetical protein ABGY24_06580 [bacterium]
MAAQRLFMGGSTHIVLDSCIRANWLDDASSSGAGRRASERE